MNLKITKLNVIINLPNRSNQIMIIKFFFFVRNKCLYTFVMLFFVITWCDGLLVKTLECGQEGCEFKPYYNLLVMSIRKNKIKFIES